MLSLSAGESVISANGLRTRIELAAWNFLETSVARPILTIFFAVHLPGSSWP